MAHCQVHCRVCPIVPCPQEQVRRSQLCIRTVRHLHLRGKPLPRLCQDVCKAFLQGIVPLAIIVARAAQQMVAVLIDLAAAPWAEYGILGCSDQG